MSPTTYGSARLVPRSEKLQPVTSPPVGPQETQPVTSVPLVPQDPDTNTARPSTIAKPALHFRPIIVVPTENPTTPVTPTPGPRSYVTPTVTTSRTPSPI